MALQAMAVTVCAAWSVHWAHCMGGPECKTVSVSACTVIYIKTYKTRCDFDEKISKYSIDLEIPIIYIYIYIYKERL